VYVAVVELAAGWPRIAEGQQVILCGQPRAELFGGVGSGRHSTWQAASQTTTSVKYNGKL
jgi:hypothetical protein